MLPADRVVGESRQVTRTEPQADVVDRTVSLGATPPARLNGELRNGFLLAARRTTAYSSSS